MKKFLALTIVAGSVLGIAATTTACNNDPMKSQIELGLRAAYGMERLATCEDTYSEEGVTGTKDDEVNGIIDCKVWNSYYSHVIMTGDNLILSKVEFSNYKTSDVTETTAKFELTSKITYKKAGNTGNFTWTGTTLKVDNVWKIVSAKEVAA